MQRKPTIFLVTYAGEPTLTDDDQLLRRAIEQQGGIGIPKCWNDPSVVWREADLAVIRSTWDYIFDLAAFRDWIGRVCIQTELVNDPRLLLWNVDKHYLLDLQAQGVAIVPTLLVNEDADSGSALESARVQYRESIVIKPTVSCGSHLTRRFTPTNEQGHADAINHLKLVLRHSAALIQPLLEEVFSQGERSLIFLEGRYSHTAPKEPFREGLSPTYPNRALVSTASEIVFCERVLSGLAVMPQYARVGHYHSRRSTVSERVGTH